jgi:hypothetical protein
MSIPKPSATRAQEGLLAGTPPIDGVLIKLGGQTYVLPPCNLATLKRHAGAIDKFSSAKEFNFGSESIDTVISLVSEALARNYEGVTADDVAEHIGLEQMQDYLQCVMDASGLFRKANPKLPADKPAAAQEGGTLGESTGTP